jgi:hypothetical protein
MGHRPKHPIPETMEYPKFQFFLLNLLGEREFVKKAKQEIDAINHLRMKEWRNPTPPRGGTGQVDPYPKRDRKFEDIYILDDYKFKKMYKKNFENKINNYIEIDVGNLSTKEAEAAILHERIHYETSRLKRPLHHIIKE